MSAKIHGLWEKLSGFRYVLIIAAVGIVLLLWPSGGTAGNDADVSVPEEVRIAALLSQIEGVGQTQVLLSDSGAVVVCRGAESASVRLRVTQAVRCYTGLGADEVEVFKLE